jgi:hypothetical protein
VTFVKGYAIMDIRKQSFLDYKTQKSPKTQKQQGQVRVEL